MKIVGMAFAALVLTILMSYTVAMYGATDEGVDLVGTDYEDQYDTQTDMMLINNSMMSVIPVIFGAAIIIGAVWSIKKAMA